VTFESGSTLLSIDDQVFEACWALRSIALPSSVEHFSGLALVVTNLSEISVADDNCHFKVIDNFLLDFESISIIRGFGDLTEVKIPKTIQTLARGCFADCRALSRVVFESGSQLSRLGHSAFRNCSALLSIWIPASVKLIHSYCFGGCNSLSNVTFEAGS
jgi:hypothetical protein